MKVPQLALIGVVAGAGLALNTAANGEFVDNGDGTSTFLLSWENAEIVGDGNIYGGVDTYAAAAGAEVLAVGWEDLSVSSANPLAPYNGDNFWGLFNVTGPGGSGWYYGVPFGGQSASEFGPASGGFKLAGAGFTVNADGTIGVGYADVGQEGDIVTGYVTGSVIIIVAGSIPAPGALALLGVAGLCGSRRRR